VPVTPDEFEDRRRNAESAALYFLRSNRGLGYASEEVMVELGNLGIFFSRDQIESGLSRLVIRRRAEAREIDGTIYYIYFSVLGFWTERG
jgi:hypothetical protein